MHMPSPRGKHVVSGSHDGKSIITTVAIIDVSVRKRHLESNASLLSGIKPYRALIDTGATTTMLSTRVVSELDLPPVGIGPFRGIHGIERSLIYLFHVAFYGEKMDSAVLEQRAIHVDKEVHNIYIYRKVIEGGEIEEQPHFDVLLGMDILGTGSLNIDKDGTFSFSF